MGSPTNPVFQEGRHNGGYVVWDPSDGMLTREAIVLLAGSGLCGAGLVLAALVIAATAIVTAIGANSGNGIVGAIVASTAARIGTYTVEFDDPTHFIVSDPSGLEIGHGNTGAAFAAGGLSFTITAGATAFAPGDSFAIVVTATTRYGPFDPTATDGHQNAAAILFSGRDATTADRRAVANVRGPMKVQAAELQWGPNVTSQAQKTAALAQLAALPGGGILSI